MEGLQPKNRDHALMLLRNMMRVRRMEEACAEHYSAGNIRGFLHLYIGEEAVATGVLAAMQPEDKVFATYREHGHALLKGMSMRSIMAEMFGKQEGCCRGRGGSMHLFSVAHHMYGGNAIVAGALPLACGVAYAERYPRVTGNVAVCFFGEGAMAEGEFHESMNLAALWQLPVLFLCENNFYAMGTALERSESETNLCKKADSYGVRASRVDGMDVLAVERAAEQALSYIRETSQPYFLECQTYRFRAHSMFDPELYRDKAEVERWKRHDPIEGYTRKLLSLDLLSDGELSDIKQQVEQELADAITFAENGTLEPLEDLERFVYWEPAAGTGREV